MEKCPCIDAINFRMKNIRINILFLCCIKLHLGFKANFKHIYIGKGNQNIHSNYTFGELVHQSEDEKTQAVGD